MKALPKALHFVQVVSVIAFVAHPNAAAAQEEIGHGESVFGEFVANRQKQEYTVHMRAGERLRLHIQSIGETLLTAFEIFDPAGNTIKRWRSAGRIEHDFRTEVLSARGSYLITVWNTRGVGAYTISVGKIASDGTQVLPGSRGP